MRALTTQSRLPVAVIEEFSIGFRAILLRQYHGSAAPQSQRARGIPFVHGNLDESARSQIRERLRAIPLRKRIHESGDRLRSYLQFDRTFARRAFRQIFLPEIRN